MVLGTLIGLRLVYSESTAFDTEKRTGSRATKNRVSTANFSLRTSVVLLIQ